VNTQNVPFAQALSRLRETHQLSQQRLAELTGYTRNYIYYLETGRRKRPSSRFIQTLCQELHLAPAERNALFAAAGFVPPQSPSHDVLPIARALLAPYLRTPIPACAVDRDGTIYLFNGALTILFEVDLVRLPPTERNILRLLMDASGFGGRVINWEAVVMAHEMLLMSLAEVNARSGAVRAALPWWRRHAVLGRFWRDAPLGPVTADLVLEHSRFGRITLSTAPIYSPQTDGLLALTYLPTGVPVEALFGQRLIAATSLQVDSA